MPSSGGNSCLDEQIERLKRCEYLREGEVKALCLRAREILVDESNVQRVDAPVTVSSNQRLSWLKMTECEYFLWYRPSIVHDRTYYRRRYGNIALESKGRVKTRKQRK